MSESKKSKKQGRNAPSCKAYANSNRREHNKIKRLNKRLVNHPNDTFAQAAIGRCKDIIRGVVKR